MNTCKTCTHWFDGSFDCEIGTITMCRRRSPCGTRDVVDLGFEKTTESDNGKVSLIRIPKATIRTAMWPPVGEDDSCGDHEPKPSE